MRSLLCLALIATVACNDVQAAPASPMATGTVFFRTDPASCTYTGTVTFLIEGIDVGTESLAPGVLSRGYVTTASSDFPRFGKPVVQAIVRGYTSATFQTPVTLWTYRTNILLPAGGSFTHTFTC